MPHSSYEGAICPACKRVNAVDVTDLMSNWGPSSGQYFMACPKCGEEFDFDIEQIPHFVSYATHRGRSGLIR